MKTAQELEKERQEELKKSEKDLFERMNNEVELEVDENERKSKKKLPTTNLKKIPANHYSVDDMEFDEPEYLQVMNKNEIKQKRLDEAKQEYDEAKESRQESTLTEEPDEEENGEDNDDLSETNTDTQSIPDSLSSVISKTNAFSEFSNDKWIVQFKNICSKLNKSSIDVKQFEKLVSSLIQKLDPSKDEKNKQRLCLLVQHFIDYYQSLFKSYCALAKSINKNSSSVRSTPEASQSKIDFSLIEVLKKFIYDLTFKYGNKSTKKEPSLYVELFKKILSNINDDYASLKISEKKVPDLSIVS